MTNNPDHPQLTAALLALLDAASALLQLPTDVRRQAIGRMSVQSLLDDAKALDRILTEQGIKNKELRIRGDQVDPPNSLIPNSVFPVPDSAPTAPNGLKRRQTIARPPKTPAPPRTPVLPPIPAATTNGDNAPAAANGDILPDPEPAHPSNRLAFEQFDKLCRAEMKRLALDGRIPNARLWDSERSPGLPTLGAVMIRYKVRTLVGLAEALGMEPPLTAKNYTINANGANAIYQEEATP